MNEAGGGQSVARVQPRGVCGIGICVWEAGGRRMGSVQLFCPTARKPSPTPTLTTHVEVSAPCRRAVGLEREVGPNVGKQMSMGLLPLESPL